MKVKDDLTPAQRRCLKAAAFFDKIGSHAYTMRVVRALEALGYLEHIGDTYGFFRITDKGRAKVENGTVG